MPSTLQADRTALILIGYQNDYFAPDGILRSVIEESAKVTNTLENTVALLDAVQGSRITIVSTPIQFTEDYRELIQPVGILKAVKEAGAFRAGSFGAQTLPEFARFGDRIVSLPGKRGLNSFSNSELESFLRDRAIEDVVIAGAVTSICIDSTGRSAFDRGFRVHILQDCTSARTPFEQDYFFEQVFPLYAQTTDSHALLRALQLA